MIMSLNGCIDMKENPHSYHTILADLLEFAYIWCCSVTMVWVQIPSKEEQIFDSSKI